MTLPSALAELGSFDEYEFVVHPRLAGHGPTLFEGLSKHVDLQLVSRVEVGSGAVALRYVPRDTNRGRSDHEAAGWRIVAADETGPQSASGRAPRGPCPS